MFRAQPATELGNVAGVVLLLTPWLPYVFGFELIVCSVYIQTHRIVAKFHNPYTQDSPFEKLGLTELVPHTEGTPWAGNWEHQQDDPKPSCAEDGDVMMGVILMMVDVSNLFSHWGVRGPCCP